MAATEVRTEASHVVKLADEESSRGFPPIAALEGTVPWLPDPEDVHRPSYLGPTEESNWVLPGRLMVGAYPSAIEDDLNEEILTSILKLGLRTFVCLQAEYQHHGVTEAEWRSGAKLRPYIFDAVDYVDKMDPSVFPAGTRPEGLAFVHFPIVDCDVVADGKVLQLAKDLVSRMKRGENMYVHCWGGHGRTGTVVSVMLGLMYDLPAREAMRWVQYFHDMRMCPMGVSSPQTREQQQQVIRILNGVHNRRRAVRARTAREKSRPTTRVTGTYGSRKVGKLVARGAGGHTRAVTSYGGRQRSSSHGSHSSVDSSGGRARGRAVSARGHGRAHTNPEAVSAMAAGGDRVSVPQLNLTGTPAAHGRRDPAGAPHTARAVMSGSSAMSPADEAAGRKIDAPMTARVSSARVTTRHKAAEAPPLKPRNAFTEHRTATNRTRTAVPRSRVRDTKDMSFGLRGRVAGGPSKSTKPKPPARSGRGRMGRRGSGGRGRKLHARSDSSKSEGGGSKARRSRMTARGDSTQSEGGATASAAAPAGIVKSSGGATTSGTARPLAPPVNPMLHVNRKGDLTPGPGLAHDIVGFPTSR